MKNSVKTMDLVTMTGTDFTKWFIERIKFLFSTIMQDNNFLLIFQCSMFHLWFHERIDLEYLLSLHLNSRKKSNSFKVALSWVSLQHNVEISVFFCRSDFTWNQFGSFWSSKNCQFDFMNFTEFWIFGYFDISKCEIPKKNLNSKAQKLLK